MHAVAITSGPPRASPPPLRPSCDGGERRCSGGRGACEPLATLGCDWHTLNDNDAGPRSAAGRRSRADRPGPGERDGPDAVQPGRGVPHPAVGDHVRLPPKTRRAIGRRDRVAQGDEQASRWPTGVRVGYVRWRSVRALEIGGACNSNGCAFVQPLYVTPTPAPGREQVCEVGRGQATRSDAVRGPERYQDDRDRMCRRITEQTTRGFAFRNAHLWRTLQTPDEPRVWLAARRVTR